MKRRKAKFSRRFIKFEVISVSRETLVIALDLGKLWPIMNMDRVTVLLLLVGLLEGSLHKMPPLNVPQSFSGSRSYAMGTEFPDETYPITEWSLSLWMQTSENGADIVNISDADFYLSWYYNTFRFYDGQDSTDKNTGDNLPPGKWIFYQLGSTSTMSYVVATVLRGVQHFISSTVKASLTTASIAQFFGDCGLEVITT